MAKILINDGIHESGLKLLKDKGFDVSIDKIPQEKLEEELPNFDAICVRSATKVRQDLIEKCPNLKVIGRGGVGLDNIDVDFARSKGIQVINTPAASSRSVAELAFAHLLSLARFLYKSNRHMPEHGREEFKALKKSYSKGFELAGKTMGIIGMGRIGQETAQIALGMGMKVLAVDPYVDKATLKMDIAGQPIESIIETVPMAEMLSNADVVSLHIPFTGQAVLTQADFNMMKDGAILINASRGGTVNEPAMLEALDNGKLSAAGLDVFEDEPKPREEILNHPNISLTPHIGASTGEAQEKIGLELAEKLIELLS
ncbi:MAG: D-2-hydroxyacid dehydrogenase [Saprospiraceae bacterium]|jgi:D-3-phosphoglycerate dehydrogenase